MAPEIRAGANASPLRTRVRRHANGRSNTPSVAERPQLPNTSTLERDGCRSVPPYREPSREPRSPLGLETSTRGRRVMTKVHDKFRFSLNQEKVFKFMRSFEAQPGGCGPGSGDLTTEQMCQALERLKVGLNPEDRDILLANADPNGSGRVNYCQFFQSLDNMQPLGNQGAAHTENYSTATAPWDERKNKMDLWNWKLRDSPLPGSNPASSAMEQEKQDAYLLSLVSPKISLNKHKLRTYLGCRNPSKDRLVTKEALVKAFDDNKLGVPRPQVERLFDMMDASGEGLIDYNYFIGAFDGGRVFDLRVPTKRSGSVSSPSLAETMDINDAEADATMRKPLTNLLQHRLFTKAEAAKAALRLHDFNGDGKLTLDELTEGCTQLVPGIEKRDVAAMMVKMDPRTDGCVDYRQFVNHVVEQTPLHPRAADGAQGRKLLSAGAPLKSTASLLESASMPARGLWGDSPMRTAPARPTCLYPKSLSASFDASSWMQNPREEKLQTNNPAMYEVIASLSASSPDLAESLRGSCPEFTRPASEGASSKAHTGKRYWPSTRKDTSTVTIPAPGTTQASTSIDDHYMRKGGGSFMSFQTEDKERKAKAHSQAKTRIEAKTDFENSRACTDQQMAEKGDQDRLSIMSFGKQRYDQRAQMYEQARMLPQPFQADKQISPIFGRDSYYASTGYQGVHGQTGQFIHGLHSLLATN